MKTTFTFLILSVIILAGCATRDEYHALLGSWIGSNETKLIRSWGEPEKIESAGHTRYLFYTRGGPSEMGEDYHSAEFAEGCTTRFETVDEVIVSFKFDGSNCVAK